ncbi:MAG: phosphatase PAP2 family protein [Actinomycetota bacterium]|nr:phosphatase PAP2 family protein [Actinomycetota bacterium]
MTPTQYPKLHWRPVALRLVGGGLLLALLICIVGWSLSAAQSLDFFAREAKVNIWAAEHRTDAWNSLTMVWSNLADTKVCIAVLLVGIVVFRIWLGRWRESWTLLAAIVGELWVFLIVTALVGRDRPPVEPLDLAPPTSSFPSGHMGAAIALYGCIAIILLRELRPRWLAIVFAVVLWTIPLMVGFSRIYRGMHFPTDVLFGAIGGSVWLTIAITTLLPREVRVPKDAPSQATSVP